MIRREEATLRLRSALGANPVVALLGPRQCGKTTLARLLAAETPSVFFDLEDPVDVRRLGALQRPRDWTVVTSDRQVARAAQERGVRVISSQAFARQLLGPASSAAPPQHDKPDIQLSEAEVAEWLQVFGEQPAPGAAPPPASAPSQPDPDANRAKRRKGRRGR